MLHVSGKTRIYGIMMTFWVVTNFMQMYFEVLVLRKRSMYNRLYLSFRSATAEEMFFPPIFYGLLHGDNVNLQPGCIRVACLAAQLFFKVRRYLEVFTLLYAGCCLKAWRHQSKLLF